MTDSTFLPEFANQGSHDCSDEETLGASIIEKDSLNQEMLNDELRRFGNAAKLELFLSTVVIIGAFWGVFAFMPALFTLIFIVSLIYLYVLHILPGIALKMIETKRFETAEKVLTSTLTQSRKLGIFGWCALIESMDYLRHLFHRQARYQECELLVRRWIAIEDTKNLKGSYLLRNSLGCVMGEQKRITEAAELLNPDQVKRTWPFGVPWRTVFSGNLGYSYLVAGKNEAARILLTRALEDRLKTNKKKDLFKSHILNNLGLAHANLGNYAEAEACLEEALSLRRTILKADHIFFGYSYYNLGRLYYAQGRYDEAELQFSSALSIREMHLPPEHPDIASTLECYALTMNRLGKKERALELLEQAEHIRQTHALLEEHRKAQDLKLLKG